MRLTLASTSPRRIQLIKSLPGLTVDVVAPLFDERTRLTEPVSVARALSSCKAQDVYDRQKTGVVLGADTVVTIDGLLLGKPKDAADAVCMLTRLSGRTHRVITGVTLIGAGKRIVGHAVTDVTFRPLDQDFIAAYVGTKKPLDKAGAYGLQDDEIRAIIEKTDGEADNVIGLPVALVRRMLEEHFSWR
ncbi:MAG: Maf family protein [Clostridiales bacterium]|jgi:septum formation protein|nr:Maf family protein [Clostridiales bacterium]